MPSRTLWTALCLVCAACASDHPGDGDGAGTGTGMVGGPMGTTQPPPGGATTTPPGGGTTTPPGGGTTGPGTTGEAGGTPDPGMMAGGGTGGAGGAPPGDCQGFSFEGLVHSPGGTTLPNTCEPFHPTTNNPYAVRCIDAWPWYKTQFPGDQYCILPPPPDKGIQIGVHPQGTQWFAQVSTGDMSGYANPPGPFILQDGMEGEANYHTATLDNATDQNFYRNYTRMRGGSHHMINSAQAPGAQSEFWGPGSPDGLFGGTSLPGAQRPDENAPKTLEKPSEDAGIYSVLPARQSVTFNMHHFNFTGGPILKEAWINLWWETDATRRAYGLNGLDLVQVATLSIAPGQTQDIHYQWNITQPIRLLTAFGHRHAWTTNFSAWVEAPGKQPEIVYQSFDWFDEPTYRYDSLTQNPVPNPEARTDGGSSGIRTLNPGEQFHYNCHIEYTDKRAAAEMIPSPSEIGTIRFANQAITGEMCILFGSTAEVRLAAPARSTQPLPSFATIGMP